MASSCSFSKNDTQVDGNIGFMTSSCSDSRF